MEEKIPELVTGIITEGKYPTYTKLHNGINCQ